jgi:hypothetical protein
MECGNTPQPRCRVCHGNGFLGLARAIGLRGTVDYVAKIVDALKQCAMQGDVPRGEALYELLRVVYLASQKQVNPPRNDQLFPPEASESIRSSIAQLRHVKEMKDREMQEEHERWKKEHVGDKDRAYHTPQPKQPRTETKEAIEGYGIPDWDFN